MKIIKGLAEATRRGKLFWAHKSDPLHKEDVYCTRIPTMLARVSLSVTRGKPSLLPFDRIRLRVICDMTEKVLFSRSRSVGLPGPLSDNLRELLLSVESLGIVTPEKIVRHLSSIHTYY